MACCAQKGGSGQANHLDKNGTRAWARGVQRRPRGLIGRRPLEKGKKKRTSLSQCNTTTKEWGEEPKLCGSTKHSCGKQKGHTLADNK